MILELIFLLIGLPLAFFLPGYLLVLLMLPRLEPISQVIFGIGVSMVLTIILSIFLSVLGDFLGFAGFNRLSIVIGLILLSLIFWEIRFIRMKKGS